MKAINIKEKFTKFSKKWHPHQIAVVDGMQVILAKLKGEFVWHSHDNEDELFQVIKGTLYMQFRDRTEVINEGEFICSNFCRACSSGNSPCSSSLTIVSSCCIAASKLNSVCSDLDIATDLICLCSSFKSDN